VEVAPRHLELNDIGQIERLYARFERSNFVSAFHTRDVHRGVVRYLSDDRDGSCILYHEFAASDRVSEVVAEQVESFRQLGKHFEWKVYGTDQPATLGDELLRQGFRRGPAESFMVLPLALAPASMYETNCPFRVRRITRTAEIDDAIAVQEQLAGRSMRDRTDALTMQLRRTPERIAIYVVYADRAPVASAWVDFNPGSPFAGLWGGATLPAYRGLGCYRALVAARAREARQRGAHYLTIDASSMSRPIVERLGFQYITQTWPYEWRSPGPSRSSLTQTEEE
jgi:GNAT superfamily N-acetyltransferase